MRTRTTVRYTGVGQSVLLCGAIVMASSWLHAQPGKVMTQSDGIGHPLVVTPSTDGDFDARITALLKDSAPVALRCKPYLAIVSNKGNRTVVAYTVAFTGRLPDGRFDKEVVQFKYPTAVLRGADDGEPVKRDREMRPGDDRVVGPYFEIDPGENLWWLEQVCAGLVARAGPTKDLRPSVEAVILDDGTVLGDVENTLAQHFEMLLDVTRSLFRDVASRLERGDAMDVVFTQLQTEAAALLPKSREETDHRVGYYLTASGDLRRWRKLAGDDRVRELLAKANQSKVFKLVKR